MKTIDLNELKAVNGGVVDPGNGQGCTRSGGCIPGPFRPQPEQPWPQPNMEGIDQGWPIGNPGMPRPVR
jgi:hypothetical protein